MAMTMQDMQILVNTMTSLAQAMTLQAQAAAANVPAAGGGGQGGQGGHGGNGRVIREKGFAEVAKLTKGQDQWEDWSYDFRIALSTMSPEMRRTLDVIQDYPTELDLQTTIDLDPERAGRINLTMRAAELFQILVLKTDGEAKLLVKSVPSEDGVRAWQMLHKHYHRKTFAKAIRDHREVMYPKPIRELAEVVKGIMEWEERATRLETSYGAMPKMLKIAALVEMLPSEIRDMVMMQPDEHQEYSQLRQKIFSWTANKIPLNSGPTPMDVGAASYHCGNCTEEEGEYGIGAINGSCYRCGGWGHAARECATPAKGKGAPEKGKGKGKSKGKGSADADKPKGKGKGGYQGTCWKCGKVGHKSAECRQVGAVDEEADEEEGDGEVQVGTVWHVGAVEASKCTVAAVRKESSDEPDANLPRLAYSNTDFSNMDETVVDVGKVECMDIDSDGFKTVRSKERKRKKVKITLDSGAGASCWPEKLWQDVPMGPKTKGVRFAAANGTALKYLGNKSMRFRPKDMRGKFGERVQGGTCEMKFHVTDTTKPLAAAMAVVKMGNRVVLDVDGSYIESKATGERIILEEEGGTYVFEVEDHPGMVEGFARQG